MLRQLILFDIDGTLIVRADPAHMAAIDAGVLASFPDFGVSIRDIDFDGKIDRQILRELLRVGCKSEDLDPAVMLAIIDAAIASYRNTWEGRHGDADLLPGVRDLIERLSSDDQFALGVLTGGIRGVVEVKLKRLGLDEYFPIGAFGDEVETRSELLPLALRRAEAHYGMAFGARAVVVGDTPHDVAAAHSGNVACLAVATGRFTVAELRAAGADAVLPDLSDTDAVISTLQSIQLTGAASWHAWQRKGP